MTFTKIWCLPSLKIKNRHFLKSGDVKTLQKNIQELFPSSNQLFGKRDKIEKGKNPMKFKDAAKKKKATANKKGKPMNLSGNSKGGMAKRKAKK